MKAKLIIGFIAIAVAALAGWNINKNQNEVILSELALANVEALANGESGGSDGCFWKWYQEDIFGGSGAAVLAKICQGCYYKYLNTASMSDRC